MPTDKIKIARRTTVIGGVGNLLLTIFKFAAGIIGHSGAMIADAVHSLSDLFTDVIVLVFMRLSNRPVDETHSYGHGKFETLATTIISVALFCVGVAIFFNGAGDIVKAIRGEQLESPGMIALWAAIISIICKEVLYQYTMSVGRSTNSPVLIANAWHHRSDAMSSLATTVGIGGAIFLGPGWQVLDPIAAVVVSIFIIMVAIELVRPAVGELLEHSLPLELQDEIIRTAKSFSNVVQPHNLRTRRVGRVNVVDMHVRMPGEMSVAVSHDIVSRMEERLHKFLGADAIINIHVEPIRDTEM
ncbi:MAG: cation diffusion facilitator family transporter [Muribaculaceae bacterium]|nr:cation diffusion facilitator family transporter [Muribaculaceae bacterium]